ncbi:MAG: chromosome partitioning protein ParA [Desulfovibrio sp. S3730MH75]|nr:MAG: chromosome partitioning protein ParA [Desulfovibrio sp. S3730MH75]
MSIILAGVLIVIIVLFIRKSSAYKKIYNRFKDVVDIETEQKEAQKRLDKLIQTENELKDSYAKKRSIYDDLMNELSIIEDDLEFTTYGIYQPHFDFDTSKAYKEKIKEVRGRQKELVREKKAAICDTKWEVGGSKAEGRKMTNRNIRLMLRAFNNECETATLKVRWNNALRMEERIRRAHTAINKMGEPNRTWITDSYLNLKQEELYLAHEHKEKLNEEKEEQRRIREQIREEEKVVREIEKAKKEADREEKQYQKALEQARADLKELHGEDLSSLNEKIKELELNLQEAQEKRERAISRAQLTKSGHIYIISNIGSFGENIYKIGMTRRLEPLDRVRELGDASVPYRFDIHGMIFSENAPELEKKLHGEFNNKRMNIVNRRKEFFNVSLEDIEKEVHKHHSDIEFTKIAEAREYRETQSIRQKEKLEKEKKQELEKRFPATL